MKKKKLKLKLKEAQEETVAERTRLHKLIHSIRDTHLKLKEVQHYDGLPDPEMVQAYTKQCSGCRVTVQLLRELYKPYDGMLLIEDIYLPALKEQLERANNIFMPMSVNENKRFAMKEYPWRDSEEKKS